MVFDPHTYQAPVGQHQTVCVVRKGDTEPAEIVIIFDTPNGAEHYAQGLNRIDPSGGGWHAQSWTVQKTL